MIREFNAINPKSIPLPTCTKQPKSSVKSRSAKRLSGPLRARGDADEIIIGDNTNIWTLPYHTNDGKPTVLGQGISVGHSVVLHGCRVMDHCIVGMGSIVLDGATVEEDCMMGAGAVVSPNTRIPKGSLALGIPARVIRALKPEELTHIRWNADEYLKLSELHRKTSRRVY